MKIFFASAVVGLLAFNPNCFAQSEAVCGHTLDAPLLTNSLLIIDSRPAGLEIVGTDQETVHVSCTANDSDGAQNIRLQLSPGHGDTRLAITGAYLKHGGVKVRIEVPRKTSLRIQMAAGEVKIDDVTGDKDVDLYAGHIAISSARAWNYRSVNASVDIGEVNAQVYGSQKGGFLRTFSKQTSDGEYRLRAHILSGQIELLGSSARAAAD